jgi:hypothetical protein
LESHQSDGKQIIYGGFRRDPLKKLSQKVVKKNDWCFQRFEHLPSESLVHLEREMDLIGKLTYHRQICEEKPLDGTLTYGRTKESLLFE